MDLILILLGFGLAVGVCVWWYHWRGAEKFKQFKRDKFGE